MRHWLPRVVLASVLVSACDGEPPPDERDVVSATTEFDDAIATSTLDQETGVISTVLAGPDGETLLTMEWDPAHRNATWEASGSELTGQIAADDARMDLAATPVQANAIAHDQWAELQRYYWDWGCYCDRVGQVCAGINVCWQDIECKLRCDVTAEGESVCDYGCETVIRCEWIWDCWLECVSWWCLT